MDLLIASRKSDLARLQAQQVGRALQNAHPHLKISYHYRESLGDQNLSDPLWKMPEKGVFTEDFRQGLLDGEFDLVVHSWKDLPIQQAQGTEVVATLPRADSRDLLIFKKNHWQSLKGKGSLRIFSSSPRRAYNLESFFLEYFPVPLKQVEFLPVRGNILTRVQKMIEESEVDGLIVAKAAIDRLLLAEDQEFQAGRQRLQGFLSACWWQVLPLANNPPAAAQGALAIEINSHRSDLKDLLQGIHCIDTWEACLRERNQLQAHGGGCHQKIGVSCQIKSYGRIEVLRGETERGQTLRQQSFNSNESLQLKKPLPKIPELFDRETLLPQISEGIQAHFVAKADALSKPDSIKPGDILWVSGLKTWKKLSQQGLWVNGCQESLGEDEDFRLQALAPSVRWAKWTHQEAPVAQWAERVAGYRLRSKASVPDFSGYQEYFWMSGSQFLEALRLHPKIIEARHFCGPGQTLRIISDVLEQHQIKQKPVVLPDYQTWKELVEENIP